METASETMQACPAEADRLRKVVARLVGYVRTAIEPAQMDRLASWRISRAMTD